MTKMLIDRPVVEQALHVAMAAEHPVKLIAALRAALADGDNLSPTEPVAWIEHEWAGTGLRKLHFEKRDPTVRDEVVNPVWTPLYTAPPQSKPLTEEEIQELSHQHKFDSRMEKFVRIIEQAHGIGGSNE